MAREQIERLRRVMKEKRLDAWISPSADAHQSEYIGDYDACRLYLSGFTGSAGTLLVLEKEAYLWTDGRYFVQAERELEGSGITLMKQGVPGVLELPAFLQEKLAPHSRLGYYAKLISASYGERLRRALPQVCFVTEEDITGHVWEERPARSSNPVWIHSLSYCGERAAEKMDRVRKQLKEKKATALALTALSDIAWLCNLRGSDIQCNPLFLSYLFLDLQKTILFIQGRALGEEVRNYLKEEGIEVREYDEWDAFLKGVRGETVALDGLECDEHTCRLLEENNRVLSEESIVSMMKIIKNETELLNDKNAHIRDGVYMVRFLRWLKEKVKREAITESAAAEYLDGLRAGDSLYISKSFPTISAYGANAAMPHYSTGDSRTVLEEKGFYLVDSGAQYKDGTTDITRTVALGPLSAEEKKQYTLVVKGMLNLLNAKFPPYIRGYNLDTYARAPLWQYGYDFNHGTGHGVGFANTVHEGPNAIRLRASETARKDPVFAPGMIVSDEPGMYVAGSHGIRMEILVAVKKDSSAPEEENSDFLSFDCLTFAPIDMTAIDFAYLEEKDVKELRSYQEAVYRVLSPHLSLEERSWLKEETSV